MYGAAVWLSFAFSNLVFYFSSRSDSWSSGSNRGFVPQTHPADWKRDDPGEETDGGSPGNVSSSLPEEDPIPPGGEAVSNPGPVPLSTSKTKPKARAAFSDSQMTALTHRFSMQRYLTPVEMKTMARLTGLTYKQVRPISLLHLKRIYLWLVI